MRTKRSMVREFHKKFKFPLDSNLKDENKDDVKNHLLKAVETLDYVADILKYVGIHNSSLGDNRAYRAHLIVEETTEVLCALAYNDLIDLADAISDLKYVAIGTEETYGIPGDLVFEEVHSSNMTKSPPTPNDPRMRIKGPKYRPPNIERILNGHRSARANHRGNEGERRKER